MRLTLKLWNELATKFSLLSQELEHLPWRICDKCDTVRESTIPGIETNIPPVEAVITEALRVFAPVPYNIRRSKSRKSRWFIIFNTCRPNNDSASVSEDGAPSLRSYGKLDHVYSHPNSERPRSLGARCSRVQTRTMARQSATSLPCECFHGI